MSKERTIDQVMSEVSLTHKQFESMDSETRSGCLRLVRKILALEGQVRSFYDERKANRENQKG